MRFVKTERLWVSADARVFFYWSYNSTMWANHWWTMNINFDPPCFHFNCNNSVRNSIIRAKVIQFFIESSSCKIELKISKKRKFKTVFLFHGFKIAIFFFRWKKNDVRYFPFSELMMSFFQNRQQKIFTNHTTAKKIAFKSDLHLTILHTLF